MPENDRVPQGDLVRFMQELIVTNRESAEATRGLQHSIDALRKEIAETYVTKETWLEVRKSDEKAGLVITQKINSLENQRDWVAKIIIGAVLVALVGLVVYANGGTP